VIGVEQEMRRVGLRRAGRMAAAGALLAGLLVGVSAGVPGAASCAWASARAQAAEPYCAQPYDAELTQDGTIYRTAVDADGNDVDLALDVYEPVGDPAGDLRPVLLWMHGGFFAFGDRKGDPEVYEDFASRGFVVVSIDYRLRPVPPGEGLAVPEKAAVDDALEDAVAAVAWIHADAAALRIDPSSVIASGYSAGAITALGLAHKDTAVSVPGSTTPIAAAVPFSGLDLYEPTPHRPDDVPVLMYNGDQDSIVPIAAAENGCRTTVVAGSECDFVELEGVGHTSGSAGEYQQMVAWLAAHGIEQLAACDRFDVPTVDYSTTTIPTTTETTTTSTTATTTTATTTTATTTTATTTTPTVAPTIPATVIPILVDPTTAAPAVPLPGSVSYTG